MPAYVQSSASLPILAIYPGGLQKVFDAEAITTKESSLAVAISNYPPGNNTPIGIDIFFNQSPTAFTINVQFAAIDQDDHYACPDNTFQITEANLDTVPLGFNKTVHFDCPFANARFVRLFVVKAPTAGGTTLVTATIKR